MALWKVTQGIAGRWQTTAIAGDGTVVTTYSGGETLAGVVWAGDMTGSLLSFTPTWASAPAGTVNSQLTGSQTATLAPAVYIVEITLADKSADLYRGQLQVLPAPGSAPALFSYVSFDRMLEFAPRAGRLFDPGSDETGFAEQRNQASKELDRRILLRYNPQPGRARRYVSDDGTTAGPFLRYSAGPAGAIAPTRATLAGYLGTSAVLMNADLDEFVAREALAIIYLGEPGSTNPYREAAVQERQLAQVAFNRALVEIDTNADNTAEIRVDQDVVWLT